MSISYTVIGRNIQRKRKLAGFTQEQFAERIGISVLHYGRLERGERSVSLVQLSTIAELLNTSVEDLLWGSTNFLPKEMKRNKSNLGLIIQFLSAGCSEKACALMIDVCQVIAARDKFHSV